MTFNKSVVCCLRFFGLTLALCITPTASNLSAQESKSPPLVGNSPDGSHSGSILMKAIAEAAMEDIQLNSSFDAEQKKRQIDAMKNANDLNEVEQVIKEGKLEIDSDDLKLGELTLWGQFQTTEISGCWTDDSFLSGTVELFQKVPNERRLIVGREKGGSYRPVLKHDTGLRCGRSDQGPMITDVGSLEMHGLGFRDEKACGYTLMLEGSDVTHWTLKSGGEIGTASFLKTYLPHLHADAETGGFGGMFLSDKQLKTHTPIVFKGRVVGTGSTTIGVLGIQFYPTNAQSTPEEDMEFQKRLMDRMTEAKVEIMKEIEKLSTEEVIEPKIDE